MQNLNRLTKEHLINLGLLSIILCYVVYRLWLGIPAIQDMRTLFDSGDYHNVSQFPLLSAEFLAGERPFTIPLLFKLTQTNFIAIGLIQLLLSILSWSTLGWQVAKNMRTDWLKPFALLLILLFSMIRNIAGWDTMLLSESLTLSLMALFIALSLSLTRDWQTKNLVFLVIIAFFWTFTRDTNAFIILFAAAVFLLLSIFIKHQRPALWLIAVIFIAFFAASRVSAGIGERANIPFQNVLLRRVLLNEADTQYFAQCGMPVTSDLLSLAGFFATDNGGVLLKAEEFEEFRTWAHSEGQGCYAGWLLADPLRSMTMPLENLDEMMGFKRKYSASYADLLGPQLEQSFYPYHIGATLFFLVWAAIPVLFFFRVWRQNPAWLIPISLILVSYPLLFLVFHGDAREIDRHALQAHILVYLGAWLILVHAADALLDLFLHNRNGDDSM